MLQKIFTNQFTKDSFYSLIFLVAVYGITHNPIVRPTPLPTPGRWSIQLMQHPLIFGLAGHNYLALRDENGNVVEELHGLATDTVTKQWKYIGTKPTDILQVWEFDNGRYLAGTNFPGIIINQGAQPDVLSLWNKALSCKDSINQENINYPPYGVSFRSETTNSNSVAYTLAKCMGFDTRHIGIWTPGDTMDLLQK